MEKKNIKFDNNRNAKTYGPVGEMGDEKKRYYQRKYRNMEETVQILPQIYCRDYCCHNMRLCWNCIDADRTR